MPAVLVNGSGWLRPAALVDGARLGGQLTSHAGLDECQVGEYSRKVDSGNMPTSAPVGALATYAYTCTLVRKAYNNLKGC